MYYSVLATVLAINLLQTVVLGSLQVAHGASVREYELEAKKVATAVSSLEQQQASHVSLASAQEFALSYNYVSITKPVVITSATTVASR